MQSINITPPFDDERLVSKINAGDKYGGPNGKTGQELLDFLRQMTLQTRAPQRLAAKRQAAQAERARVPGLPIDLAREAVQQPSVMGQTFEAAKGARTRRRQAAGQLTQQFCYFDCESGV